MFEILAITAPIFLLMALGYVCVRSEYVPKAWLPALGGFVIRVALPAMLFKSLSQRSFAEVMNLRYIAAYALGSLCVLGCGLVWARLIRRQPLESASLVGMGMACANSSFIGYPIALQVVGPAATVAVALAMMVENMLMIPLCLALAECAGGRHEPFHVALGRALLRLRSSPIIIAIFLAFAFAVFHVGLPASLVRGVDMLAAASAPVALFYIGGSLVGLPLRDMFVDMGMVSLGKLVLHPLAICVALLLLGPIDPQLAIAAVLIAGAPMLSIYPIFGQQHGIQGFCAATLLVATVASFFTVALIIWLLQTWRFA